MPAKGERQYSTRFSRHTARFISFELTMRLRLESERSRRVQVRTHYYLIPATSPFKTQEEDHVVYADKDSRPYQWGFGSEQPGSWRPGTYRVVIFIDGVQFAEESFTITKDTGQVADVSPALKPPDIERHIPWHGHQGDSTVSLPNRQQTCLPTGKIQTDAAHTAQGQASPKHESLIPLPQAPASPEMLDEAERSGDGATPPPARFDQRAEKRAALMRANMRRLGRSGAGDKNTDPDG
jgi:hypothetical protein